MTQIRDVWRLFKKEDYMRYFVPRKLLLASLSLLAVGQLQAVVWDGNVVNDGTTNSNNRPITTSGSNVTLDINANCTIDGSGSNGNVFIAADSPHTVTVNVNNGDRTISAADNSDPSVLLFEVSDPDGKIEINLNGNNLTYQGVAGTNTKGLLLIAHGASGADPAIEYLMTDNSSVIITSANQTDQTTQDNTAAEHYIDIDGSGENVLRFTRNNQASNSDATLSVGPGGVMSYITSLGAATTGTGTARYQFDASNDEANTGRLKWNVGNNGKVDIRSIENGQSTKDFSSIEFADLNKALSKPAGSPDARAVVEFVEPGSWAGTFITNSNETFPTLNSDPFCQGTSPSLIQPGMIIGENGSWVVNNNAYVDYVGLKTNITPSPGGGVGAGDIKDRNPSALFIDGSSFNPFYGDGSSESRAEFKFNGNSKIYFRSGVGANGDATEGPSGNAVSRFTVSSTNQPDNGFGHIVWDVEAPLNVNGVNPAFAPGGSNAINVLSYEEKVVGGTVLVTDNPANQNPSGSTPPVPVFKTRSFNLEPDTGEYVQYAKAAVMNNSRVYLNDVALQHTDAIHRVFSKNTSEQSEPTYIGGERLCDRLSPGMLSTSQTVDLSSGDNKTVIINGVEVILNHDDSAGELNASATFDGVTKSVTINDTTSSPGNSATISNVGGLDITITNNVATSDEVDITSASFSEDATQRFKAIQWRPAFVFNNSQLRLNDSAAFTGVDLVVPEVGNTPNFPGLSAQANNSSFIFFSNGYQVDQGTGRNLILGTNIGATASNRNTIIDRDAHLDVQQEFRLGTTSAPAHNLEIRTNQNDNQVTEGIPSNHTANQGQNSVHSIYLAHGSNISVGVDAPDPLAGENPETARRFNLETNPTLTINGSFLSFESQGGIRNKPELSILTGQGGIFVGNNGVFELQNGRRALFNAMVGQSFDGAIDLKRQLARFGDGFGITPITLDLRNGDQTFSSSLSDLIIDWKFARKNYESFTPYVPEGLPIAGSTGMTPITSANLANLPTIEGRIGQLQIQNSRIGDPAHIKIGNNGFVRELIFMAREDGAMPQTGLLARDNNPDPGIAAVGNVIINDGGTVGLGPIPTRNESSEGSITLGVNGVTLIPDGDAEVILNSDVVVENNSHIVPGPNFGDNTLTITSETERELRIKSGAVLDLSLFNSANKKLAIAGKVTVVAEPGARVILGNVTSVNQQAPGTLEFTDEARFVAEKSVTSISGNSDPSGTDAQRVKIHGYGSWIFSEDSSMHIPRDSIVGIEGLSLQAIADSIGADQQSLTTINAYADINYISTNLTWLFQDDARLQIGSASEFGGALQVGNASAITVGDPGDDALVNFTLQLSGRNARAEVGSQGFLGLGAGIVNKTAGAPNNWEIGSLNSLNNVTIDIREGKFIHNRIFDGSDDRASLLALSNTSDLNSGSTTNPVSPNNGISFVMDDQLARVFGGGNMYRIDSLPVNRVQPQVGTTNNDQKGILAPKGILFDTSKLNGFTITRGSGLTALGRNPFVGTSSPDTMSNAFSYLKMNNFSDQDEPLAAIYERRLGQPVIGYVDGNTINRIINVPLNGLNGTSPSVDAAFEHGIVGLLLGPAGSPTAYNVVTT